MSLKLFNIPCFILLISFIHIASANDLIGKSIYDFGRTDSGIAYLEEGKIQVPATLFACKNCHGVDANGTQEGGVVAPAIRWFRLSQDQRTTPNGGSFRNAYTRSSFLNLLRVGVNSNRNKISTVMPRYDISKEEANALVDYLDDINTLPEPGITDATINLGIGLPSNTTLAQSLKRLLNTYIQNINSTGGIYRRTITLQYYQLAEVSHDTLKKATLSCCLVHLFMNYAELDSIPTLLQERNLVLSIYANSKSNVNNSNSTLISKANLYSLIPRGVNQSKLLEMFALKRKFVLHSTDVAESAIFIDSQNLTKHIENLKDYHHSAPILLISGLISNKSLEQLKLYPSQAYTAVAYQPRLISKSRYRQFQSLMENIDRNTRYRSEHILALSLTQLFLHIMRQTGYDIRLEKLHAMMSEPIYLQSGFGPELHFNQNKHVGITGGLIIRLNTLKHSNLPRYSYMDLPE